MCFQNYPHDLSSLKMSGSWHPIHDNHAIDVMAAIVSFAEPIPDLVFKKALKISEDVAFSNGLRSRHPHPGGQFLLSVGADGSQNLMQAGLPTPGRIFNSILELSDDQPVSNRIAEQVQITNSFVAYRTWRYVSWTWQLARMKKLLEPSLSIANSVVFFGSQRLEYLDRFRFDGEAGSATVSDVLRSGSERLAPHIFSRTDLWHSHTGAYRPDDGTTKKLEQIHVDMIDDAPSSVRWINIMTAREDRFNDREVDQSVNGFFANFDTMHGELIEILASVLTPGISDRIYLKGAE
jgi:hypothetical protein